MDQNQKNMNHETGNVAFMTLLYFAVSLIGILNHEIWLDEAHHWLLARDSGSISELFANTRREGHPILWNLLLFGITRLTTNPVWMQVFHVLISTSAVYVFLRHAPFRWIFKILFVFGYFMLFEYNLISRNYVLGILFLFLACSSLFQPTNFLRTCIFLAMAVNVHVMFAAPCLAIFLTLLFFGTASKMTKKGRLAAVAVFCFGFIILLIQITNMESSWMLDRINQQSLTERIGHAIPTFFKGVFMIPDFTADRFWNTNLIVNRFRPLAIVLTFIAYLIPIFLFRKRPTLFFVYLALLGTQFFFFITGQLASRFNGMSYLILIIGLWMEKRESGSVIKWDLTSFKTPIIYAILAIHFSSGIYAYTMDAVYTFTSTKEIAAFLDDNNLANEKIASATCDGTVLSAYLERKVWFLCEGREQSFCIWDSGCPGIVEPADVRNLLIDYMAAESKVFYVSSYPLDVNINKGWQVLSDNSKYRMIKSFTPAITDKSPYYIYEIRCSR